MIFITSSDIRMLASLQSKIDQREIERGVPVTQIEKLANLRYALREWKCFICKKKVKFGTEVCPHCGQDLM